MHMLCAFAIIKEALHYAEEIWKRSFISTARATVYANPSRKQSFEKTPFKPEEFETASFSFSCGRKTFCKNENH